MPRKTTRVDSLNKVIEKEREKKKVLPPPEPPVVLPTVEEVIEEEEGGLFEGLEDVPEDAIVPVPARPLDGIPPLDGDLDETDKEEFVKLLNSLMPLETRARKLTQLASFTDTKRAPVALRAIQEINAITGLTGEAAGETTPLFVLPAGAKVGVTVVKVEK